MALPYPRKFNAGHGSELLYNEELHKNFEATKHLLDKPEDKMVPKTELDGALWLKRENSSNELKTWDKSRGKWVDIFADKFQIIDQITNNVVPPNPVKGQLWLYNGVLCFYDGIQWRPVKAMTQDGSQFDLSVFNNFILLSPLWKQGNTVIQDDDIEEFMKVRREYLQGKVDLMADSTYTSSPKWKPGDKIELDEPNLSEIKLQGNCQFVVPDITHERIFMNDRLDNTYVAENPVTIHYPKQYLLDKTPSLVHVNPGKLCGISKRLFRIDRQNPRIPVSTLNTEYYGFRLGDKFGHFLCPEGSQDDGGYIQDHNEGIILSYNQAQNYDYVLAVTFEFKQTNPNGFMNHAINDHKTTSYFVPDFEGANNVFVNGLALENLDYDEDSHSSTVTINEDTSRLEVQMLHSGTKEWGFVRDMTLDGKAIVRVLHDYKQPLIFMNGEAMNPAVAELSYDRDKNTFQVQRGRMNMAWVVMELYDYNHPIVNSKGNYLTEDGYEANYKIVDGLKGKVEKGPYRILGTDKDGNPTFDESRVVTLQYYNMMDSMGIVSDTNSNGQGIIHYHNDDIITKSRLDEDGKEIGKYVAHAILFIDGLIVRQDDLTIDPLNKTITAPQLRPGQDYILLKDKYDYMVSSTDILPALEVEKLSESMVYLNGYLVCNSSALTTTYTPEQTAIKALNHQVIHFVGNDVAADQEYMEYDEESKKWVKYDSETRSKIRQMTSSYENTPRTVRFNFEWSKDTDVIDIYAFNYATDIEHTLIIENLPAEYDDPDSIYDKDNRILSTVMTGDATEVAPNGIHYFESDIRDMIDKLPQSFLDTLPKDAVHLDEAKQMMRKEAIRRLSVQKKYNVEYYHKFSIANKYVPSIGSLCVYVNGVRQYDVQEINDNMFAIPWPVRGIVTYTIELPENGNAVVAEREVLNSQNAAEGLINVYRTNISLFPGRIVVFIDGIRQPKDSYIIVDNHTIMFRDKKTRLLGNEYNYPDEVMIGLDEKPITIHHTEDDRILVEVFKDYDWQEDHAYLERTNLNFVIRMNHYDLNPAMLRSQDEIKIYIDGLFFGLKDHDGYFKDDDRGTLTINRPETIARLISDPLYEYLIKTEGAMEAYHQVRNEELIHEYISSTYNVTRDQAIKYLIDKGLYNQDREPEQKDIILEWR